MIRKAVFALAVWLCGGLIYGGFLSGKVWAAERSQYDFLANLRTLPARSAFSLEMDRHLILTRRQAIDRFDARFKDRWLKEYSVWALGNVHFLSVNKNEGGFNAFSNGVQVGIDFLNDGGVFGAYRKIDARYDDSQASGQEIEAGLYKYFFDINLLGIISAFNVWAALGFSNFDEDNRLIFNSRAVKGGFEIDLGRKTIIPFVGARGGYASNGSVSDREGFIMEADDYLRAEVLGGFKTVLEFGNAAFSFKAYGGFLPIWESEEIDIKNRGEDIRIKAVREEKFFGGAVVFGQWSVFEGFLISSAAGGETDMDGTIGFYGNFALNYRFMRVNIMDRSPRKAQQVVEKKVEGGQKLKKYREESNKAKEGEVNEQQFLIIFDDKTGEPSKIIETK